jgi:exodeoxyribonuclease VII small subunit
VAQEQQPTTPERYEEIVQRLGQLVERLEGGGLSLEEAIQAFEQGIRLARAGATKLDEAEKRVDVLLENDRTQPFEAARAEATPVASRTTASTMPGTVKGRRGDEDIPF